MMPLKVYPVTDGFFLMQGRRPIPKSCVKHYIDGYQGKPFSGRVVMSTEYSSREYQVETEPLRWYRAGENARLDVDNGKRRLTPAEYITANAQDFEVVEPNAPKKERQPLSEEQRRQKAEAKAAANIYRDLPKIVVVLGVQDYGPCDMGATAICPHCGAEGRYIYSFKCADGSTRGAMRGCLSKFPRHPFAAESQRILEKEQDYKQRSWALPSWDIAIKEAIFAFAEGQIPEEVAMARVRTAQEARRRYKERRRR